MELLNVILEAFILPWKMQQEASAILFGQPGVYAIQLLWAVDLVILAYYYCNFLNKVYSRFTERGCLLIFGNLKIFLKIFDEVYNEVRQEMNPHHYWG